MAKINVLDAHVADLIAAGEVVERPASVVKELLENSFDAGAAAVTVEIKNGGISYIRVTDNGSGISREDAPTAFLRHATSKISKESDLESIKTLGFRGEALAAISAVSKIDLLTKIRSEEYGSSLHIEAGTLISQDDAGCPEGTTIVVRELFYNTPARMKFLRRDAAEGAAVEAIVSSEAMSHPDISIKFIRDEREVLHTPGDNNLKSCIYALYGRDFVSGMLNAESKFNAVNVYGFTSSPLSARGNRMMQFFFVNGRPIKSRMLGAALDESYKDQIMKGRFPSCVIFISLPHEMVDVNVHPAKTEVKFTHEREVFDAVYFAIKSGLSQDNGRAKTEFLHNVKAEPQKREDNVKPNQIVLEPITPKIEFPEEIKTPINKHPITEEIPIEKRAADVIKSKWESIQVPEKPIKQENSVFRSENAVYDMPVAPVTKPENADNQPAPFKVLGEVLKTYIIVEQGDSLLIIDKHAAHERIIFERLKETRGAVQSQLFLAPVVLKLTKSEITVLAEHRDEVLSLGFEIDDFGEDAVIVRQAPDGIDEPDVLPVVSKMADSFLKGARAGSIESLDEVIYSVACKAAIRAGSASGIKELENLAGQVLGREDIRYCPHGRPIVFEMTRNQLEKQFKRIT